MKKFNINNYVKVKLTNLGAKSINELHKESNQFFKDNGMKDMNLKEDYKEGDIYEAQMWQVMSIFSDLCNGMETPFINCEIYFKEEDLIDEN